MINNLIIIFLMLFAFSFFSNASDRADIKKILNEIPINDQESLEYFFRQMIAYQNFGYVIFGKKPMAWVQLHMKIIRLDEGKSIFKYNRFLHGYNTWLKYQHLFHMENYIFRSYLHEFDFSTHMIIFLNRGKTLEVIKNNLSFFKDKLGRSITPEKILSDLETKDNIIETVFRGNHDLLGIILGFGIHNSIQFQKRYYLFRNKHLSIPYDYRTMKNIWEFNARILDEIYFNLTGIPHENKKLFFIDLPYFAQDSQNPESTQILQNYFADQKLISETYSQGKFLEITLEALTKKNQ
jgi:hypothetical protein